MHPVPQAWGTRPASSPRNSSSRNRRICLSWKHDFSAFLPLEALHSCSAVPPWQASCSITTPCSPCPSTAGCSAGRGCGQGTHLPLPPSPPGGQGQQPRPAPTSVPPGSAPSRPLGPCPPLAAYSRARAPWGPDPGRLLGSPLAGRALAAGSWGGGRGDLCARGAAAVLAVPRASAGGSGGRCGAGGRVV